MGFEVRVEFSGVFGNDGIGERDFNDPADGVLEVVEEVVEFDEIQLGFDVGIFRQVAAKGISRRGTTDRCRKRYREKQCRFPSIVETTVSNTPFHCSS